MNLLIAKGTWNVAKGKLLQKYAQLTHEDVAFVEGEEDELLGRLQKRLGLAQDEIEREIQELLLDPAPDPRVPR